MNNLSDFYSSVRFHLLEAYFENFESIAGYAEAEIAAAEFTNLLICPMHLINAGLGKHKPVDFQELFPYSQ
jgi:hypothetical protein